MLGPLEHEMSVVVSCPVWTLGLDSGPSVRAVPAGSCGLFSKMEACCVARTGLELKAILVHSPPVQGIHVCTTTLHSAMDLLFL